MASPLSHFSCLTCLLLLHQVIVVFGCCPQPSSFPTSGPLHWRFPRPSLGFLNGRCLLSLNLTSSDYTFGNKTYFLSMCPVYFLPVYFLPICLLFFVRLPFRTSAPSVARIVTQITCGMNDPWLAIAWWALSSPPSLPGPWSISQQSRTRCQDP